MHGHQDTDHVHELGSCTLCDTRARAEQPTLPEETFGVGIAHAGGSGGMAVITGDVSPPKEPSPAVIVRGEMGNIGLALTPFQDSNGRLGIRVERAEPEKVRGVGLFIVGTDDYPADKLGIVAQDIIAFGWQG